MNIDNLRQLLDGDDRYAALSALWTVAPDLLAAVEALERLTDAAGPIGEDDGPDHIFAPTDPEWQEFEAALADARAVLRRLRGEEGDR